MCGIVGKIILLIRVSCCRNYATLHDRTRKLEEDNDEMENRLKELKIAMGREKAQREYDGIGIYVCIILRICDSNYRYKDYYSRLIIISVLGMVLSYQLVEARSWQFVYELCNP